MKLGDLRWAILRDHDGLRVARVRVTSAPLIVDGALMVDDLKYDRMHRIMPAELFADRLDATRHMALLVLQGGIQDPDYACDCLNCRRLQC